MFDEGKWTFIIDKNGRVEEEEVFGTLQMLH